MFRNIIVFVLLMLSSSNILAQGFNNLWLMGYQNNNPLPFGATNIDFISGSPTVYHDSVRTMEFGLTEACVTDSLGSLLFYSNGAWIANRNNVLMQNGDSLNPSNYTTSYYNIGLRGVNSHLIVKCPGSDSLFILIHQTIDNNTNGWAANHVYYSIINMSLAGGLGAVTLKNQIFLNDSLNFTMTTCKHANGRDWWVIIPKWGHPEYYVYLLTPTGIQFISKQTIGVRTTSGGQAVFSRDGSIYVLYDAITDLEIFDFDRCSGVFSNGRHVSINDGMSGTGVGVSANNRFIYASSGIYLYQFDVLNPQNYITVATWDSFYSPSPPFSTLFFTQELMQDDKIYINTGNGTDYLHVIEYPDSFGLACQVNQHSLHLPTYNASSTPYYPNYFLGPVVGSICDSLSVSVKENKVQSADLRLNPNPCQNQVWVNYHFPNNKDGWLSIYDSMGQLVLKRRLYWSTTQLLVYLQDLQPGIYVVKVMDDSNMYVSTSKLVKE